MVFGPAPLCLKCIYFHDNKDDRFTCDAFPDGIPDEIILRGFNHSTPFPGDKGLRFKPQVKFAVVGPGAPELSPYAAEVLGRITMGSTDPGYVSRMRTQISEIDRIVSDLPAGSHVAVWKAFYRIVDEIKTHRKK